MNNQISATLPVASSIHILFSGAVTRKIILALAGVLFTVIGASQADAQFSKPVVVLKGTVYTEQTGRVQSVKVSIRSAENKGLEITSSRSNSVSGSYLVVLEPKKKYWVHLESRGIISKDELIETPAADENTVQMNKDFTISKTSAKDLSEKNVPKS